MTATVDAPAPVRRGHPAGFGLALGAILVMMAGASAPSPFYPVLQRDIGFSSATLTGIFAVYAVALLLTLLVTGSLSDHLGRRPVLSGALALLAVSMLVFWHADSVTLLVTARVVQGVASGLLLSSLTATVVDLEPPSRPGLAATANSVMPMAGLALGALVGGFVIDRADSPAGRRLRRPRRCLRRPRAGRVAAARDLPAPRRRPAVVPAHGRRPGLRPTGLRAQRPGPVRGLGHRWALPLARRADRGAGARRRRPRRAGARGHRPDRRRRRWPASWPATGPRARSRSTARPRSPSAPRSRWSRSPSAPTGASSPPPWSPARASAPRSSASCARSRPTVGPDERGELFASVFVVSYLAFGIPAVVAGIAAPHVGLATTTYAYGGLVIVLSGDGRAAAQVPLDRLTRATAESAPRRRPPSSCWSWCGAVQRPGCRGGPSRSRLS